MGINQYPQREAVSYTCSKKWSVFYASMKLLSPSHAVILPLDHPLPMTTGWQQPLHATLLAVCHGHTVHQQHDIVLVSTAAFFSFRCRMCLGKTVGLLCEDLRLGVSENPIHIILVFASSSSTLSSPSSPLPSSSFVPSVFFERRSQGWLVECCFTSTETVGLLGTGAQDGHPDFHTPPELWSLRGYNGGGGGGGGSYKCLSM